jgi:hypothetical protein
MLPNTYPIHTQWHAFLCVCRLKPKSLLIRLIPAFSWYTEIFRTYPAAAGRLTGNKQKSPDVPGLFLLSGCGQTYLYCGISPFARLTILFRLSSFSWPFLNSASTSGSLFSISIRKCDSNSFTFFTDTSLSNPCVPR